jgi:hypothetical protein
MISIYIKLSNWCCKIWPICDFILTLLQPFRETCADWVCFGSSCSWSSICWHQRYTYSTSANILVVSSVTSRLITNSLVEPSDLTLLIPKLATKHDPEPVPSTVRPLYLFPQGHSLCYVSWTRTMLLCLMFKLQIFRLRTETSWFLLLLL